MGLDWIAGARAKAGHEEEFRKLWKKIHEGCFFRKRAVKRYNEITESAFETLKVPRVGYDEQATRWARERFFPRRVDKSLDEAAFLAGMKGYYVAAQVPRCAGLPKYSNGAAGYVDETSFRGKFLTCAEEVIGEDLLNEAWVSKLPEDTLAYGRRLIEAAEKFASARGIDLAMIQNPKEDSVEEQLDIVLAAGRWCEFWGERGHWLEAYF